MTKSICIIQNNIISGKSGGYEIQIYHLFRQLINKGWKVYYITEGEDRREYEFDGFYVFTFPKRHYLSFFNPAVLHVLENQPVSIVYHRSRTAFSTGSIGIRFAKKNNAKFVFSIGSRDDLIPLFLTKSLWKSGIPILKKIIASADTVIKDTLFKRNFFKADLIVAQNIFQQTECKKMFGRSSIIINSGHPSPSSDSYVKDVPLTVCWIANSRAVKQPELFYHLASQCKDISNKFGVTFIMVMGKNISEYHNSVLMKKLKAQSNMVLIGEQSIDEANAIMGRASVLVNTSIYEGFSNTYIQAWMRETPVVTLQCDPDGVIEKHKLGFHSRSLDQLVRDVKFLAENENIRKEMGVRARRYAVENHSIEKSADILNHFFEELIR